MALHDKNKEKFRENEALRKELENLSEHLTQLLSENEAIRTQMSAVTAQFLSIESSTIWRMTKPLRAILDLFKRLLKGSK